MGVSLVVAAEEAVVGGALAPRTVAEGVVAGVLAGPVLPAAEAGLDVARLLVGRASL